MTNTKLLLEIIDTSGLKKKYIASKLHITAYGLQKKINNESEFKASEISELCIILNIKSPKKREEIFFAKEVDFKST